VVAVVVDLMGQVIQAQLPAVLVAVQVLLAVELAQREPLIKDMPVGMNMGQ
jgi:hypothetical protein